MPDITVSADIHALMQCADNAAIRAAIGLGTSAAVEFDSLTLGAPNNATGLTITGGSITGSGTTPSLSITQTWNTSGIVNGIFANFTNTASDANSNVIQLQVGGSPVFTIGRDGYFRQSIATAGNIEGFNNITSLFGQFISKNQVFIGAEGNGILRLLDASTLNSFNRLQFGGTDTNYPAIKRSTTILQARLADDSAFTVLQADLRTTANAVAEAIVPTHTVLIQDATGTSYKIPVQAA